MRTLIRAHDWRRTALGDPALWPASLRTAVEIMLDSAAPAYIAWGPQFIQLYNDAYIAVLGPRKHPQALGWRTDETWREIWDVIGPLFRNVIENGTAVSYKNHLLCMLREDYLEECYFTFSYSPLTDDDGRIGGVFVTAWETTAEYVNNRRANAVRMLAQGLAEATDMRHIRAAFERTARACAYDIPFALWYEMRHDRSGFDLVAAAGIEPGLPPSPVFLDCRNDPFYAGFVDPDTPAMTARAVGAGMSGTTGAHAERPRPELVCIKPLCYTTRPQPDGYIVLAANPMRAYDQAQKDFHLSIRLHLENAVRRVNRQNLEWREREHQFQSVMAAVPCLVRLYDAAQRCILVNHAGLEFTGRALEQELGDGWLGNIHPEDRESVRRFQRDLSRGVEWTVEYRLRDAQGHYHWMLDKVTPRHGIHGEFLGYIGTGIDITERKTAEQELVSSQAALRALYDRLQKVREEERLALAREVHDQLGQILSAAKIDIKLMEDDVRGAAAPPPRAALLAELQSARASIDQAIRTVRQIASELRAPELGAQGLYAALTWHAQDFERRTRIACRVSIASNLREPTGDVALALLRVFQEALTNVLRHANANRVQVCVLRRGHSVLLRVLDNGIGIRRSRARSHYSLGLKGMRERAALLHGRLVVGRVRPRGTLVALRIPFAEEKNAQNKGEGTG